MTFQLILASGSPRRQEFISYLNIPFEVIVSSIDECSTANLPQDFAVDVAQKKGLHVYQQLQEQKGDDFGKNFFPVVCSADTIVVLENKIFGKPSDEKEAVDILMTLAGKTHQVITGVSLIYFSKTTQRKLQKNFSAETHVTFDKMSKKDLELYLATKDPMDKAGAYGIQGPALVMIKSLQGSYSNVVGLPLNETIHELQQLMKPDLEILGAERWRELFHE